MTETSPDDAARLLAEAHRLRGAVADAARTRYVAWLVGMAAATVGFYAGLAAGPEHAAVPSITYGVTVAALSGSLLPFARISSRGFSGRWVRALLGWGLLYGVTLTAGLTLFANQPLYWLPASLVAVAPLVDGARREMRA
jgi:hypothetical protein